MNLDNESLAFQHRTYHCVTSLRQFLIIFGGISGSPWKPCNQLWAYNTINGICRWYPAPVKTVETNSNSSICTVGDKVYIFGCTGSHLRNGRTNSLVSFNIRNVSWQNLSPRINEYQQDIPPPMFRSLLFYNDESLYIIGCIEDEGRMDIDGEERFKFINIFDFSNNTWTSKETRSKTQMYPSDRYNESFTSSGNFYFLSGGKSSVGIESDIWRIDLETFEWIKLDIFWGYVSTLEGLQYVPKITSSPSTIVSSMPRTYQQITEFSKPNRPKLYFKKFGGFRPDSISLNTFFSENIVKVDQAAVRYRTDIIDLSAAFGFVIMRTDLDRS
ncbi:hypothetical protein RF11_16449 [Thelohanellus kitauei]|uniref:Kelch domain-containing protein 10 n=1 Tax=Thelohanellus kitauei TaxID=669202 RepID=A0A0C2MHM0_THEKT|nr:hypothetical protein RF11_16449 [Thelohanellus kitauei]